MKNEIEVEWEASPKSGLTQINVTDLGCKDKNEWNTLNRKEQTKRLTSFLLENELGAVKFTPKEWYDYE